MQINFPPPPFQFLPPNAEGLKSLHLGPKGPFMWPKATKNEACVATSQPATHQYDPAMYGITSLFPWNRC